MPFSELILTSFGLSMDAFSVALCKGLATKNLKAKDCFKIGAYFGFFQALMPLIGYFLGFKLKNFISAIDHFIIFTMLFMVGFNMILDALSKKEMELNGQTDFKTMLILSIATSLDALALGLTLAFLEVNIFTSILVIGIITFLITSLGVKIGHVFGLKYEKLAPFLGGVILILLGFKILLEHLGAI